MHAICSVIGTEKLLYSSFLHCFIAVKAVVILVHYLLYTVLSVLHFSLQSLPTWQTELNHTHMDTARCPKCLIRPRILIITDIYCITAIKILQLFLSPEHKNDWRSAALSLNARSERAAAEHSDPSTSVNARALLVE